MEINFQCFQCTLCLSSPTARSSSALAINSQRQPKQRQQTSNKILKYECSCLCCLPLLGALVVVPPAKNSKIHAHATSSLDTFAMHTRVSASLLNPSHSLLLALPPLLQLQAAAACFLVHFTCRLFSDAMRLQKPACYVLKLVCNIFVSTTTTTAVQERASERER